MAGCKPCTFNLIAVSHNYYTISKVTRTVRLANNVLMMINPLVGQK